jgi:arginine exporter protein ArgO
VLIAVWLVKSLPLDIVRWGVIAVVLYTAVTLIRSAVENNRTLAAARASSPANL